MMKIRRTLLAAITATALLGNAWAQEAAVGAFTPEVGQAGKDVVWVPTSQALVDAMLDMAGLTAQDYLIDLGSGDGRTVITAAMRGARAHGIEYNPDMVALSKQAAGAAGVSDRATFEEADIFESDFSKASVISLFLLPNLNLRLRPTLLDMAPGTRVVSNSFDMGDWEPDDTVRVDGEGCTGYCNAYKWIIPAKVEGSWKMEGGGVLALTQAFQMLSGSLRKDGEPQEISDAKLSGADITFTVGKDVYTGRVDGDSMGGRNDSGKDWRATKQP